VLKRDRRKAHVTLLKTELAFIAAALAMSAFVLGYFAGRDGRSAVFELSPISYTEQATGRSAPALPASAAAPKPEKASKAAETSAAGQNPAQPETAGGTSASDEMKSQEPQEGGQSEAAPQESVGKININTADASQLMSLPGIGEVLAGRIIEYREKNGAFRNIYEIMDVRGIGEKTFQKLENLICVE